MSTPPILRADTAVTEDILPEPRNPGPVTTTEAEIATTARRTGYVAAAAASSPTIAPHAATHLSALCVLSQTPSSGCWPVSYFANVSAYETAAAFYATNTGRVAAQVVFGTTALVTVTLAVAIARTAYNNYNAPSVEGRASWLGVASQLVPWRWS